MRFLNFDVTMEETTKTELDGGIWKFRYDSAEGQLLEKEDPYGGITIYSYGDSPDSKTVYSPDGLRSTISTYDIQRNVTDVIDTELVAPNRTSSSTFTYNNLGQILTATTPLDGAYDKSGTPVTIATTTYEYYDDGRIKSIDDPLNPPTFFNYTPQGTDLIMTVTDPRGKVMTVVFDEKERIKSVTRPGSEDATSHYSYDTSGYLSTITDALDRMTEYKHDSLGRLVQIINPLLERTTYTYYENDNLKSIIDGEGNETTYEYTNMGQMKKVTDALLNDTNMEFGSAGCPSCGGTVDKLLNLTDANTKPTTFTYDLIGRLLTETDISGLQKGISYNSNRYQYTTTDARSVSITYTLDYMGRLVEKRYPDQTTESYTYYISGLLESATNSNSSYTYTYYSDGNLRSVTDGSGKIVSYQYDDAGNRTNMSVTGMTDVSYSYTDANQLDTITHGTDVYDFDYYNDSNRKKLTYPNNVVTDYTFDPAGRLNMIDTKNSQSQTIAYHNYTVHDKVGNRKQVVTEDKTIDYIYDDVYRLTDATHTKTAGTLVENYTYDDIGNRETSSNGLVNNFDVEGEIITIGNVDYIYKNNILTPIILKSGTTNYEYDFDNRLERVDRTANGITTVVEYKYDPFGRRIERKVTKETVVTITRYLYDREDIILEYDGSGNAMKEYIHGPGIDEPLMVKDLSDGSKYYYHADGLGSAINMSDEGGNKVTGYGYDSFGNLISHAFGGSYSYTGREWDADAGLYYYRARFYDPEVGRFITQDPIGFAGGDVNLYSYVGQNPVNFVDPYGLWRNPWDIKDEAERLSREENSGLSGEWNGQADAYRHCLASCMMTSENGMFAAWLFGEANEVRGNWFNNQETGERCMDYNNNAAGSGFGDSATSTASCQSSCMNATLNGTLQTYTQGTTEGYWY